MSAPMPGPAPTGPAPMPPPMPPPPMYGMPPPMMRPRTAMPTAAGVLLIIAGILASINFAILFALGSGLEALLPGFGAIVVVCGAIGLIFSIFAIIGGVMSIQRKMWALALIGSILGLFTIGFVFTSSILSLIALILIAVSRQEFT